MLIKILRSRFTILLLILTCFSTAIIVTGGEVLHQYAHHHSETDEACAWSQFLIQAFYIFIAGLCFSLAVLSGLEVFLNLPSYQIHILFWKSLRGPPAFISIF